jgi:hypothetical protein
LGWADQLVIAQKPAPQQLESIRASGLPVTDLVGLEEFRGAAGAINLPRHPPEEELPRQPMQS